jgi:hypothetical protein
LTGDFGIPDDQTGSNALTTGDGFKEEEEEEEGLAQRKRKRKRREKFLSSNHCVLRMFAIVFSSIFFLEKVESGYRFIV